MHTQSPVPIGKAPEGFEPANTTPIPDGVFECLGDLSGTELKVLLSIIRHTIGMKLGAAAISLTQFEHRCGLARNTICIALQSLENQGYIICQKRTAHTTFYSIRFKDAAEVVE